MHGKRILLGVTGGIAAYKSADLVRRLRERGAEVQVVMTRHHDLNFGPSLAKAPDEVRTLICGDAARDAEQDALAVHEWSSLTAGRAPPSLDALSGRGAWQAN